VFSVISAGSAVFTDNKFFRCIGFISFGYVVEVTAFGTLQSHMLTRSFFSHSGDILAQAGGLCDS